MAQIFRELYSERLVGRLTFTAAEIMLTLSGLLIQITQLNLVVTIFEHLNVKFLIVSKLKKKKKKST